MGRSRHSLAEKLAYPFCASPRPSAEQENMLSWSQLLKQGLELIELAKRKCPPPAEWDGKKKLPWPIAIYSEGKRYDNIEAYSVSGNWFKATNCPPYAGSFLVQRLH